MSDNSYLEKQKMLLEMAEKYQENEAVISEMFDRKKENQDAVLKKIAEDLAPILSVFNSCNVSYSKTHLDKSDYCFDIKQNSQNDPFLTINNETGEAVLNCHFYADHVKAEFYNVLDGIKEDFIKNWNSIVEEITDCIFLDFEKTIMGQTEMIHKIQEETISFEQTINEMLGYEQDAPDRPNEEFEELEWE